MKKLKKVLFLLLMTVMLCGNTIVVSADEDVSGNDSSYGNPSDQYVSSEWKDHFRFQLNHHYSDLKLRYKLTEDQIRRMDRIYNSAMDYMKNAEFMMSELTSYETEVEGYLDEIAKEEKESFTSTQKFLMLSNESDNKRKLWRAGFCRIVIDQSWQGGCHGRCGDAHCVK